MGYKKLQEKIPLRGHHKITTKYDARAVYVYLNILLCIKMRNTRNQRVYTYQLLNYKPRHRNIAHIYRADTTKNKCNSDNDFYPFTH